jgi:hypothetical protein
VGGRGQCHHRQHHQQRQQQQNQQPPDSRPPFLYGFVSCTRPAPLLQPVRGGGACQPLAWQDGHSSNGGGGSRSSATPPTAAAAAKGGILPPVPHSLHLQGMPISTAQQAGSCVGGEGVPCGPDPHLLPMNSSIHTVGKGNGMPPQHPAAASAGCWGRRHEQQQQQQQQRLNLGMTQLLPASKAQVPGATAAAGLVVAHTLQVLGPHLCRHCLTRRSARWAIVAVAQWKGWWWGGGVD